jgi:hypothetical protein
MCQCTQRDTILSDAARQAISGRLSAIGPAINFTMRTIGEDANAIAARALAAAKARLGKR